jgi:hypothetical protein
MMQRKLTDEELQDVMHARHYLRKVTTFADLLQSRIAMKYLDLVATHGTTDGKPYIEPQPEVGDGYRVATEADKDRRDLEFWSKTGGGWQHRKTIYGTPLDPDYDYRVPIDRIPTDEDARQRPTVMVMGNIADGWHARRLLGVTEMGFLVASGDGFTNWKQARFPYPGELD